MESLAIITAVDPEDSLPAASVAVAVKVFVHSDNGVLIENNQLLTPLATTISPL